MEGNERAEVSDIDKAPTRHKDNRLTLPSRREIKQIEQRKRERRKRLQAKQRKQEAEKEERMMQIMAQNPQLAMLQQAGGTLPMMSGGVGAMPMYASPPPPPPPQADTSGNPYAPRY
jgi:hypothetical protein